jgi:hypothetical protein
MLSTVQSPTIVLLIGPKSAAVGDGVKKPEGPILQNTQI